MDKIPARYKAKNKKSPANAKPKTSKKRKSDGPTCSMFLADLSRRLALKKRQEEESPRNIVQTIIESITNALPIKFSRKSPPKSTSPMRIETLQTFAPELLPNDTLNILPPIIITNEKEDDDISMNESNTQMQTAKHGSFKMPKMPLVSNDILRLAIQKKKEVMKDMSVNTAPEVDVASEITKHVNTLKKISLIAEEFNQKTAKNLKEIVDSVQEDLLKKLEEIQAEQQKAAVAANKSNEALQTIKQGVPMIIEEKV